MRQVSLGDANWFPWIELDKLHLRRLMGRLQHRKQKGSTILRRSAIEKKGAVAPQQSSRVSPKPVAMNSEASGFGETRLRTKTRRRHAHLG
jgi:hypothetical protein